MPSEILQKNNTSTPLQRALWFHRMGFNVVPFLSPEERTSAKATNLPWKNGKEKNLQVERQTEEDILKLAGGSNPNYNFTHGMLAINGISDLHSFDIDKADSTDALYILLDKLGLPHDYQWITQSGSYRGYHVWFHNAEGDTVLLATGLPDRDNEPGTALAKYDRPAINPEHFLHMELRWHASLTALPGSLHPSGNLYRFVNDAPTEKPVTVSTERIKAAWDALVQPYEIMEAGQTIHIEDTGEAEQIARENETPYGLAVLKGVIADIENLTDGNNRYNTIFGKAWYLFEWANGGQLNHDHIAEEIYAACERNGALQHHGDAKIRDNIANALEGAGTTKRVPPKKKTASTVCPNGIPEPDVSLVLDCLAQGEWGDSILFSTIFRGRVLYDHTSQEWYLWNKHHWLCDNTKQIKHYVSGELASVYIRAGATLNIQVSKQEAAILDGDDDQEQAKARIAKLKKTVHSLTERAFALRSVSRNNNVLTFACSQPGMGITIKEWDTNKWLLAVANGVIDLHTGELRDGKPEDYIRTVSPTIWKGLDAPVSRFERFWREIFEMKCVVVDGEKHYLKRTPDELQRLLSFIQRFFGYAITGEVYEHVFGMFYGEDGRNGKDTIETALSYVLGDISEAVSKDVLLETGGKSKAAGSASPHLMDLIGKRLAWANEPEKGSRFAIGQIKDLSGGGEIPARGLYEKKITKIDPTHQLLLLTNHKPVADPNDKAFWERLRLITFDMRFIENPKEANERKKDVQLVGALKNEASGILAWLVRGCLEWQEDGLQTPQEVIDDGLQYRDEQDIIQLFIKECCVLQEKVKTQASLLYKSYETWCKEGNRHPKSDTSFYLELAKKNLAKKREAIGSVYRGIAIREIVYGSVGSCTPPAFSDEIACRADLQQKTLENSVGYDVPPTQPNEAACRAGLQGINSDKNVGYVGYRNKVVKNESHEGPFSEFMSDTLHTLHSDKVIGGINEPVEQINEHVGLGENPTQYPTQTIHTPTPQQQPDVKTDAFLNDDLSSIAAKSPYIARRMNEARQEEWEV